MQPPVPLSGPAREFWNRHAPRLTDAGVLTEADRETFAVLCLTWEKVLHLSQFEPGADRYREMVQLANMLKQYHSFAKQFGLMPRERKLAKMGQEKPEEDEFGI